MPPICIAAGGFDKFTLPVKDLANSRCHPRILPVHIVVRWLGQFTLPMESLMEGVTSSHCHPRIWPGHIVRPMAWPVHIAAL